MPRFSVGSLVKAREREWIVLPSEHDDILMLRPLGGSEAETCGIFLPLEGNAVQGASFELPAAGDAGDFVSGRLLRDAARLSLRSGAGPFRSLGVLGVRPRPYQLVPLIMALKLDPVRLLIADDVGIGKTIEAGTIVRELLARGEVRRFTVLCPPHLCDQWQRELRDKFAVDAVVVRSSTVAQLERRLPPGDVSIWQHYPFVVASIDYVKSDRNRPLFEQHCPELLVVDEAHGASRPGSKSRGQQQRYELLRRLAARSERHLLLLTATPHSGVEESFRSLLGLLRPSFEERPVEEMDESERAELVRHFVQRRRADVRQWLGEDTPFPERETLDITYSLARAPQYRKLFEDVYAFARELVASPSMLARRQRVRYWAALALLRCVMSSPAAAERALSARADNLAQSEPDEAAADELFGDYVYDRTDQESALDVEPARVVAEGSGSAERVTLRGFARRARELAGAGDPKLQAAREQVERLLRDGFNPIIYCRYIATARYVAEQLAQAKNIRALRELRVMAITGEQSEDEREALVAELEQSPRRLLVCTDCLSEGINLQSAFDAVVHYDLPWNPNRLEQREGRVDRYGQPRPRVRALLLYGADNPIDEAVMRVLLRKARHIHQTLGITVPLPLDSETVLESVITTLFRQGPRQLELFDTAEQLALIDDAPGVDEVEQAWNSAVERQSRTRFAQRAIKPEDVARELEESDAVLGDQAAVEAFVRDACERLGAPLQRQARPANGVDEWRLAVAPLPQPVLERIRPLIQRGNKQLTELRLCFDGPETAEVQLVGRNHPLTTALADWTLESALLPGGDGLLAARCGVARSSAVTRRTVLLLLRARMLIGDGGTPLLAEEIVVRGFSGRPDAPEWLDQSAALDLLRRAIPEQATAPDEGRDHINRALEQVRSIGPTLDSIARERARALSESHNRVRSTLRAARTSVEPNLPPDVLGVYVLLPVL